MPSTTAYLPHHHLQHTLKMHSQLHKHQKPQLQKSRATDGAGPLLRCSRQNSGQGWSGPRGSRFHVASSPSSVMYEAPAEFVTSKEQYMTMYKQSITNPDAFWGSIAEQFHWEQKWQPEHVSYNFDVRKGERPPPKGVPACPGTRMCLLLWL